MKTEKLKPLITACIVAVFLFSNTAIKAQSENVVIKGRITDCKIQAQLVNHQAIVRMLFKDSAGTAIPVDSAGNYTFIVSKKLLQKKPVYVYASGNRSGKTAKPVKALKTDPCELINRYEPDGYFQSSLYELNIVNDTTVLDICLNAVLVCGPAPAIGFKKNSTEMTDYNGHAADTILQYIHCLMQEYPKLVIGIRAHADRLEKNPVKLSAERAEAARQRLIAMGIDSARIKTESFGSKEWIYAPMPEKPLAEQEKERAVNRRVVFVTISTD